MACRNISCWDAQVAVGHEADCERSGTPRTRRRPSRNALVFAALAVVGLSTFFWPPREAYAQPAELCNGIDDDGDGEIDEGFALGEVCQVAGGACLTGGFTVCTADGTGVECQATGGAQQEAPEGPPGDASCFDGIDNDCDSFVDHADPACQSNELCNGFDDDYDGQTDEDFADLGSPCTAGTGFCERSGTKVCTAAGTGTTCSAVPATPLSEGVPGSASCRDGVDNDCDGVVDVADPACQQPERCNALDDDGDGDIDEDFAVGEDCTSGVGACAVAGHFACLPDGSDVFCDGTPLLPTAEGPAGATCQDGVDNDCDGRTDTADPSCSSAALRAACSLPIIKRDRGASCTALHLIQFGAVNAPAAVATGELLAVSPSGAVLASIPVKNGDTAQILNGSFSVQTNSKGSKHLIAAPIPMLRVVVDDGTRKAEAYCAVLPFVDLVTPRGILGQVSSQGGPTEIVAAIPRNDVRFLAVEVDGVNIVPALGLNPATAFPGGPYGGAVAIGSDTVQITDLVVESGGLATPSANTVRLFVAGLQGGRHVVTIRGRAAADALPAPGSMHCLDDDVVASVNIDSFEIVITAPLPGEVVSTVPTHVTGEVRHGRRIASASVNGLSVPVDGQVFQPGTGPAGTWVLPFDAALGRTDLLADIRGLTTGVSTFDAGPNRLIVQASDEAGNRTFAGHIFAVGDLLPTSSLAAQSRARHALGSDGIGIQLHEGAQVQGAMAAVLQKDGVARIIEAYCENSVDAFEELLAPALNRFLECEQADDPAAIGCAEGSGDALPDEAEVDNACNPDLHYELRTAQFRDGDSITCGAEFGVSEFGEGILTIPVTMPDIIFQLAITGGCSTFAWHSVHVDILEEITIRDPSGTLTLKAADFLSDTLMPVANFSLSEDQMELRKISDNSGGGGFLPSLLSYLYDAANIASLGLLKLGVFLGSELWDAISSLWESGSAPQTFSFQFPIDLSGFGLNGDFIVSAMLGFQASLANVVINEGGLTAVLDASVMPTNLDPDIPEIPGIVSTPADVPNTSVDTVSGLGLFAIADDTVNALLAGLTAQGQFKSVCSDGTPIADFLPDQCCELIGADCCNGVPGTCGSGVEIPVCNALKAPSCGGIADQFTRDVCNLLKQQRNITGQTKVFLCGRQEVPPRLLIRDNFDVDGNPVNTPNQIETHLRLNDTRVVAVLDRDLTGSPGDLEVLPSCISTGGTVDCRVLETCLDLNVFNTLSLDLASLIPTLRITVGAIQNLPRPPGVVCQGELPFLFIPNVIDLALSSPAVQGITVAIDLNTPLLQPEGFDLLGFGRLASPSLAAVRTTEATPGFDDYLALVGSVEAIP